MYSLHYQNYLLSFVLGCLCAGVTSSNILVVSPVPSESHFKISESITTGLASAGHTVTIVSAFDYKSQNFSKVESIPLTGAVKWAEKFKAKHLGAFEKLPVDTIVSILFYGGVDLCNLTLTHPDVRALFSQTYDLVIVDVFGTESLIGLGQIFNAPVIGFSAYSAARWTNVFPFSYKSSFPARMASLFYRIQNSIFYVYESIVLAYLHHPLQRSVYDNAFPNVKLSYDEARISVAITFVNSHSFLTEPMTNVPNIIEVGGIHVERKKLAKPKPSLPQDIKQFIDTATDGVVYISFGSIMKGEKLSTNQRSALLNTFAKFKQKFVWKFSDRTVQMPKNVLAESRCPKADILQHKNVKAFITPGGLLDCIEAVYHGVPILAIPLFDDQKVNVKRASETGWAVTLDYRNITATSIEWALNEILQERYSETARAVSKQYRDQPMTPIGTMVYWSEYVIRHKGAPRLVSNYIQYHNVDVFVAMFCFIILSVYVVKWTMQKVLSRKSRLRVKVERKEQ